MKKSSHILDNKMTYYDYLLISKEMTFKLEEELARLEKKPKKVKKQEIHYEIY
jgi:hypothetical protein